MMELRAQKDRAKAPPNRATNLHQAMMATSHRTKTPRILTLTPARTLARTMAATKRRRMTRKVATDKAAQAASVDAAIVVDADAIAMAIALPPRTRKARARRNTLRQRHQHHAPNQRTRNDQLRIVATAADAKAPDAKVEDETVAVTAADAKADAAVAEVVADAEVVAVAVVAAATVAHRTRRTELHAQKHPKHRGPLRLPALRARHQQPVRSRARSTEVVASSHQVNARAAATSNVAEPATRLSARIHGLDRHKRSRGRPISGVA